MIVKLTLVERFFAAPLERSPGGMLRFLYWGLVLFVVGHCEIGYEGRTRSCDIPSQNQTRNIKKGSRSMIKNDILPIKETFWAVLALHGVQMLWYIHKGLRGINELKCNWVIGNRLPIVF